MAITWGTERKNGSGNGMRVGYEFSQSPSSVGAGTSSVTVTLKLYVWTRASLSDSTNSFTVTGNFSSSGDVSISHGGGGGTTLVRTLTRTVSPSYSGTVKSSFTASLSGINAISGTASVSGTWTTGKRPVSSPDDPTNALVSRSSDSRQVVSWTRVNPGTASKPYETQEIRRWDVASGEFRAIATVSGSVSSYTDSSTKGNAQYRYAVRAKNSGGTSGWAYTDYISTTPNPPSALKAQKQGSDIKLTWANTTGTRITGIEVWLTPDGVDEPARHVLLTGQPTSWTHASPDPAMTWQYRIKTQSGADVNDVAPNLYSLFSGRSNTVQLLAPPAAPTGLRPSATAMDGLEDQTFTWLHNPVDTTDQTAYELQYRVDGGSWVGTGKVTSGNQFRDFAADTFTNGSSVEWQVRTWGDHADASPWSSIAVVNVSARPAVTILYPDGSAGVPVHFSSGITAEWAYFDPESTTQTSVRLRLEDENGTAVWSSTLTMSSTEYEIPYKLADAATYTLVVSVRDAAGLWSYESTQAFTVEYAKPPAPLIEPVWDLDLGGVVISIEHPEPDETEAEAVSADLQRSYDGAEWETIAAGLDPTTSMVDFIPALDTVNYYRVVSYSALPSSLDSQPVPVSVVSKGWVFVNGGPDWSYICRIRDNVETTHTPKRSKVMNHFAGRRFPVMTAGEERTRVISLSGRTSGGGSTSVEWETLADFDAPVCYREPGPAYGGAGSRLFAAFQDYSRSRNRRIEEVSMSFEQVEEV